MNFGAMLSGVAGGWNEGDKINIAQESNRIQRDDLAMKGEQAKMQQLRELGTQGLDTINATVEAALEQGIVDPQKLAQANAGIIQNLQQLDAVAGTNYAQQAQARINGLSGSGEMNGGLGPRPAWWAEPSKGWAYETETDPATGQRRYVTNERGEGKLINYQGNVPAENAAKASVIMGALEGSDEWIPQLLKEPEGIAGGAKQVFDYLTSGTPIATNLGGKAVAYKKAAQLAEGNARALTGAAMPDTETSRFASFFTPSPMEDITIQRAKMEASVTFARQYLAKVYEGRGQIDPNDKETLAAAKAAFEQFKQDYPEQTALIESAKPVDTAAFLKDREGGGRKTEFTDRRDWLDDGATEARKLLKADPKKADYVKEKLREGGWTADELERYGF